MAAGKTTKNTAKKVSGRAKEVAGVAVGNKDLEQEGRVDQIEAGIRQAGNRLQDAFNSLVKALKI